MARPSPRPAAALLHASTAFALWCVCASLPARAQEPQDSADAARLIEVLSLVPGSFVADVGAGSGRLTVPLARHVGPGGRVYSTDVNPDRLRELREAAERAGLGNVVVLEGAPAQTNLPPACCDAVFMRNVYHHFGDPEAMNASLLATVKPGGLLAVVDFPPDDGRSAAPGARDDGDAHGVMPETVVEELSGAGFVEVRRLPWPAGDAFLVVARRPPSGGPS